jgi:hypothetical protein
MLIPALGMPGSGKTSLAVAATHHADVQHAFNDTIIWQSVGKEANPLVVLSRWCQLLRASHVLDGLSAAGTSDADRKAKATGDGLRSNLLRNDARVLFVLDDVWYARQIEPLLVAAGRCATIITKRNLTIAEEIVPSGQSYPLPRLSADESVELLQELEHFHV